MIFFIKNKQLFSQKKLFTFKEGAFRQQKGWVSGWVGLENGHFC